MYSSYAWISWSDDSQNASCLSVGISTISSIFGGNILSFSREVWDPGDLEKFMSAKKVPNVCLQL